MSIEEPDWTSFMRKHWRAAAMLGLAAALAFIWGVYIFLWFVGNAQSSGLVPGTLGLWTMANLVTFIIYAIFWELLLVGVPIAIVAVLGWQWWKRLPEEERKGQFGGRKRSASGGGVSLLFFIGFCLKVFIDGKWNVPIASFALDYVVGSMITILVWGVIIFGIPIAIGLILWISRGMKKP